MKTLHSLQLMNAAFVATNKIADFLLQIETLHSLQPMKTLHSLQQTKTLHSLQQMTHY